MSKICTNIKQSKKLIELGLDPNSADMRYDGAMMEIEVPKVKYNGLGIPAWSLSALWDINNTCGIAPHNYGSDDFSSEKLLDKLYRWICNELQEDAEGVNLLLSDNGYLKKEK